MKFKLLILNDNGPGQSIGLNGETLIGRSEDCKIKLLGKEVSRRHCSIEPCGQDHLKIKDLGSTNGTFVNGHKIECKDIKDGDVFTVGRNMFMLVKEEESIRPPSEIVIGEICSNTTVKEPVEELAPSSSPFLS
jgi:pSer/pThr/pTyr-binding forkhead associated (FHA) protein